MKIFLDTIDIDKVRYFKNYGLVDGITTNPSLLSRLGEHHRHDKLMELCSEIEGPVSVEVIATEYTAMVSEGRKISEMSKNMVVKLPLNNQGLRACKILSDDGIKVNLTLCFSSGQALLAAKCGANFISPFIGRLDDLNYDGISLIQDICDIYSSYNFKTQVLVASVRSPLQIIKVAKIGANIVTVPPLILTKMMDNPLTDKGLDLFLKDWHESKHVSL